MQSIISQPSPAGQAKTLAAELLGATAFTALASQAGVNATLAGLFFVMQPFVAVTSWVFPILALVGGLAGLATGRRELLLLALVLALVRRRRSNDMGLTSAGLFAGLACGLWVGADSSVVTGLLWTAGIGLLALTPAAGARDPGARPRNVAVTAAGVAFCWLVIAAVAVAVPQQAALLAAGLAAGALAARRLSGGKVEPGLVPLGSLGLAAGLLLASPAAAGFFAALFLIPLESLVVERGGWVAPATTVLGAGAVWLGAASAVAFEHPLEWAAAAALAATIYVLTLVPDYLLRFALWLLTHSVYRIRIVGQANVPRRGPALLIANHVSMVDGLLVGACLQRFIRFLVYRPYYERKSLRWLFRLMKAIPVAGGDRQEVEQALERARQELREGHVVCIFAEGSVSRTGNLLRFKRGFERILEGLESPVPVIPVHLDRLWGSVFSFDRGRFFWKWPQKIPYPVTVSFGRALAATVTAHQARAAVGELGADAVSQRRHRRDLLHLRFIAAAKRRWFSFSMADSGGRVLSCGRTLIAARLLAGWIERRCPRQPMIGLLLPASVGGALANIATLLAGATPVNLNFTAGAEAMRSAVAQCGIQTILTSRVFLAKAKLEALDRMVFLEEVLGEFSGFQRARAAVLTFLAPARLLQWRHNRGRHTPDSLATVIFSSGSTGVPKGVMLSHHNVISNLEAIAQVFWVNPQDRILGVLPLFHSFGFTVTLWLPLVAGFGAVYHPNPTDAQTIGELAERYQATILTSTPTFCAAYLRRCEAKQFASLRHALVGAEKLRPSLAQAFREKFGVELLEGYGATEMAPVVAVNSPGFEQGRERQVGSKPGTLGHPLPGVAVRVVDPHSRETLGPNQEGLLLLRGPNRMMGYLGQPEKTAEALDQGWYVSGDIGSLDEDGFLRLTDRLSRFSKIGGEMAPHLRIEEALSSLLAEGAACAITAVEDQQKGERLVAFHTDRTVSAAELWTRLGRSDLPRLWIPRQDCIHYVEALPVLGTGKLDLRGLKALARQVAGGWLLTTDY